MLDKELSYQELSKLVPSVDRQAMETLYIIEVSLREFIVSELSVVNGPKWYKSALPGGQIMEKYRSAKEYESDTPWQLLVPLHPVYYLDFPDLATIIERGNNWDSCFKRIFVRKDVFIGSLRALEPIRNAVAHHRKLSDASLNQLEAFLKAFINAVGKDHIERLVRKCTDALEVGHVLTTMREELDASLEAVESATALPIRDAWFKAKGSWWFESEYLNVNVSPIEHFFNYLLPEYEILSKGWGSGPKIQEWVRAQSFADIAHESRAILTELLEVWRKYESET